MLRVVGELVLHVAAFPGMRRRRLSAECHSDVMPAVLPQTNSDTRIRSNTTTIAANTSDPQALMVSSITARSADMRPSNHEGVLTRQTRPVATPGVGPTDSTAPTAASAASAAQHYYQHEQLTLAQQRATTRTPPLRSPASGAAPTCNTPKSPSQPGPNPLPPQPNRPIHPAHDQPRHPSHQEDAGPQGLKPARHTTRPAAESRWSSSPSLSACHLKTSGD
jgi:hypothetical protein